MRTSLGGTDSVLAIGVEQRDEREVDEVAAMVFAGMLGAQSRIEPREAVVGNGQGATEIWRSMDRELTAATSSISEAGAAEGQVGGGAGLDGRLIAHVETAELGRMSLVVDRSDGGINVTVRVEGDAAEAAVEAQRGALMARLASMGIRVGSVAVGRIGAGTVFAPSPCRTASGQAPDGTADAERQYQAKRARERRLNYTG